MSDHEFEKKVKQQLDELKFRPSQTVWTGVEKKIRGDKRRRRALLWLPLLFLGLAAGGYWVYTGNTTPAGSSLVKNSATTGQPEKVAGNNTKTTTAPTPEINDPANTNTPDKTVTSVADKEKTAPAENSIEKITTDRANNTRKAQPQTDNVTTDASKGNNQSASSIKKSTQQPVKETTGKPVVANNENRTGNKAAVDDIAPQRNANTDGKTINDKPPAEDLTQPGTPVETKESEPLLLKPVNILPRVNNLYNINTGLAIDSISGEDGLFKSTVPQKDIAIFNNKSKWQWGVELNGGFSNISQEGFFNLPAIFGEQKNLVEDLSYNSPTLNFNTFGNISINPPLNEASEIRTGYAYSAGGYVQRTFTRRFAVSAGLSYSYLSVQTTIGQRVNNQRAVNIGTSMSQLVDYYYGGRNTRNFTSRYHFIELPVTTHTQLNRNERLPVVLDAGLSVSRLITTNALHYDGVQGIYYSDESLYNKMQLGLNAGLTLGVFQRSAHPVFIGPSFHYSFTGLVKKDVSSGQYLWSTGLNIKMLLKK